MHTISYHSGLHFLEPQHLHREASPYFKWIVKLLNMWWRSCVCDLYFSSLIQLFISSIKFDVIQKYGKR